MIGKMGILGVIVLLASATGCTMCCHPYDECGPVYDPSSCRSFCSNERAGSILSGSTAPVQPAAAEEVIEENSQGVSTVTEQPATEVEPRMLSTADQKAGQKAVAPKSQSARRAVHRSGDFADPRVKQW
jgi:hypothetical protein